MPDSTPIAALLEADLAKDERKSMYFDCFCTDIGHLIRFTYEPGDAEDSDHDWPPMLEACMYFDVWQPWHKRLWMAARFIAGRGIGPGEHFGAWNMKRSDAARLREFINQFEVKYDQFKTTNPNFHDL